MSLPKFSIGRPVGVAMFYLAVVALGILSFTRLPIDLLPSGWPRARAREVCVAVYDGLAQPAQDHVRAVVARYDEEPRPDIQAHTIAAMSAGISHS